MADLDGKSEDRVVLFLGSSSAGTSLVIDELASPPGDEDDVTTSDIDESLEASSHIVSRGPLEMRYTKFDGSKSSTRMVFTGSPGLPDASGLGVSFLDEIMEHVKQHPPHGIVFVLRADCQYTPDLKYALMAMKECFNNMLSESRLLVYVTNLPSLSTLLEEGIEEDEEQVKRQEELARDVANHVVHYALGPDHLEGFQNFIGQVEENESDSLERLKRSLNDFPLQPLNSSQLRTWQEVKKYLDTAEVDRKMIEGNWRVILDRIEEDLAFTRKYVSDSEGFMGLAKKVACVSMTDALLEIRAKIERAHSMLEFYRKRWKEKDDDLQLLSRDPTGALAKERQRCQAVREQLKNLEAQIHASAEQKRSKL